MRVGWCIPVIRTTNQDSRTVTNHIMFNNWKFKTQNDNKFFYQQDLRAREKWNQEKIVRTTRLKGESKITRILCFTERSDLITEYLL